MPYLEEFHEKAETERWMHSLNKLTCHKDNKGEIISALAWDDLTGMRLKADKVIEARDKEVRYVRDLKVRERSRGEWHRPGVGKKKIKTRWIDIGRGDDDKLVYRSRLVGKEFNNEVMDGIVAGTPPLEAFRYIVHEAATIRK